MAVAIAKLATAADVIPREKSMANEAQCSMRSVLFDSFSAIPREWQDVCLPDDLAMDLNMLSVLQRTLKDQCRCWGMIIYDASDRAIGCAALCSFKSGLIKVLFCGLPVPSGATHLRIREGVCAKTVMEEIERTMRILANSLKCHLVVFKEFSDSLQFLSTPLLGLGYLRGEIPPMHLLEKSFASFADYRNAVKSRYRAQIRRSEQKLHAAGFEVLCGRGTTFFLKHFNYEAHQLYVAVQRRAKHKLELLPAAFFSELAIALGDEVSLTLIRRNGRVCAFTFAVTRSGTHYNLYSGLDYALNNEGDLYFNLFYADLDQAFRAGATSLHLGQTSDDFKSRLGTQTEQLHFFAHAVSPILHAILRFVSPLAFPKVEPVRPHDVFSKS